MSRLDRLRRMSGEEIHWRAASAARTAAQRIEARLRVPRWNRLDLASALRAGALDVAGRSALARQDWRAVHDALAGAIRGRASRFVIDPAGAGALRSAVLARWPSAASEAASRAERVLAGRYDLLGYGNLMLEREGTIDWHFDPAHNRRAPESFWADVPYLDPEIGDHKILWELNRHQHWLQLGRALWLTGDVRDARAIVNQMEQWLVANPPLRGVNWASMLEIGFRSISWTAALHFLLGHEEHKGNGHEGHEEHEVVITRNTEQQNLRDLRDLRGNTLRDLRGPSSSWLVDMLVGLDRQLTHVEQNLSYYFSPNTHLTGEALALYVTGLALPELAASERRVETGRRILLAEIDRQILADGGHAERSTHYQRYTLDFYLLACLAAERARDVAPAARFRDAAARLAEFTLAMANDAGRLPLIGDDDGGMLWPIAGRECRDVRDSLALAAVVLERPDLARWGVPEEVFWIAGPRAASAFEPLAGARSGQAAAVTSRAFPDTGYFVARDDSGGHAVLDAGAHGYMNGGHAHADALAITLDVAGQPLLVDPGTSTYTMDARLRNHLRSSQSHNTITLDDRSPSVPSGPFHWKTRADGRLHAFRHNPSFDWAEASHDGYAPVTHRRSLLRTVDAGWLIVDEILGSGRHAAAAHWHFDPGWALTEDAPGRLRAVRDGGQVAWLLHDGDSQMLVRGDETAGPPRAESKAVSRGLGWYAPVYGRLEPTWTARIEREADAPLVILTWIGMSLSPEEGAPSLYRVPSACATGGPGIAARVIAGSRTSVFFLQPGEPLRDRRVCEVLDYETNARVLHYETDGPRLRVLDVVDGTSARSLRDGWPGFSASAPISDLHAAFDGDVLDLRASNPPGDLRLEGQALAHVRTVRANGREVGGHVSRPDGTRLILGGDWRELLGSGAAFAEKLVARCE